MRNAAAKVNVWMKTASIASPNDRAALLVAERNRTRSLDAPSWLWNSVVQLVSTHAGAYLEHCRRYPMMLAA